MFLLVATTVWTCINLYLALRLVTGVVAPERRRVAWGLVVVNIALLPAAFFAHIGGYLSTGPFFWIAYTAAGFTLTLFPLMAVKDLLLAPIVLFDKIKGYDRTGDFDPARRAILTGGANLALLAAAGGMTGIGLATARSGPYPKTVDVPFPGLPPAFDGYRIVQISDTHFGPMVRGEYARRIVDIAMGFEPDLVAVTGDFADGAVAELEPLLAPLRELAAPDGVYFITGNHEYYWDLTGWLFAVERLGMTLLLNDHRVVDRPGGRIVVAGITDYTAGDHFPPHRSDPAKAVADAPTDRDATIFLAHQPRSAAAVAAAGADLALFGHTHGGQFFPWTLIVPRLHPVPLGLARYGGMTTYVSAGTVYWGPPLRTFNPPEVTLLTLRSVGARMKKKGA
jgi:predicted MPP superfamily phosphohydrolase